MALSFQRSANVSAILWNYLLKHLWWMSAGLQKPCYIQGVLYVSLVSEFSYRISCFTLKNKGLETFSIIILLIRTNNSCTIVILLLYYTATYTVMTWIIWFSTITCDAPATSNINHKHHAVDLFNLGCLILSILLSMIRLKSADCRVKGWC